MECVEMELSNTPRCVTTVMMYRAMDALPGVLMSLERWHGR